MTNAACRNAPTARGMWWADVTSSQRSAGFGAASALLNTAFSAVVRARSSAMMRLGAMPKLSNIFTATSASVAPRAIK